MRSTELAKRYAVALFGALGPISENEKALKSLREWESVFNKDVNVSEFFSSKKIDSSLKLQVLDSVLTSSSTAPEVKNLLRLLVIKGRTQVFGEVVIAFQDLLDHVNGVARGVVKSTISLEPEERAKISSKIEGVLKKKTVLDFQVDSSIVGGLRAEVGSFSFDDSVESHLKKMTEELKRRIV